MHAFKTNVRDRGVGVLHGRGEIGGARCDAEHSSAGREVHVVALAGGRVKPSHARNRLGFIKSSNLFSSFERPRIAAGGDDHAYRRLGRPTEVPVADAALNGSFERLHEIAFETHEYGLRFR